MSLEGENVTEGAVERSEVDELLADQEPSDYIDQVVELYEASERNYRAAMLAGHVVNGFTDSTNY